MKLLGKRPARHDPRTLKLARYLSDLPAVPAARDWSISVPWDGDPMLNDNLGICGIAAPGHYLRLMSLLRGFPDPVTNLGLLDAYKAVGGYDNTPDTDNGCVMLDVFKRWRNVGICGVQIEGFISLDPLNKKQLAVAAELFGGVFLGLNLPVSAQAQDIWDVPMVDSPAWGGHAVYVPAFSPGLLVCDTWGERRPLTPAFLSAYCDEAYAVFSPDLFPVASGVDVDSLRSDLGRLA